MDTLYQILDSRQYYTENSYITIMQLNITIIVII